MNGGGGGGGFRETVYAVKYTGKCIRGDTSLPATLPMQLQERLHRAVQMSQGNTPMHGPVQHIILILSLNTCRTIIHFACYIPTYWIQSNTKCQPFCKMATISAPGQICDVPISNNLS